MSARSLGIYIHIPFCIKKCNYCDFLSFPTDEELKPVYIDALVKEIRLYGRMENFRDRMVSTVFFGGGTPSILESKYIGQIFDALHESFAFADTPEITMECNPGTLNLPKLADYKYMGVNRLSIGLQSACDTELSSLGRIHTFTGFLESYRDAKKAGFDNINIDLMSALPGQTLSSYETTLQKVLALKPAHISAYSLIIEEGTPFFDIYDNYMPGTGYAPLPDEDTERAMYHMTGDLLGQAGYHRYEISNYALFGRECLHNLDCWRRREYLGLGLGSSSFIGNRRFKNTTDMNRYIELFSEAADALPSSLLEEDILLTLKDAMAEFMFLGLRTMTGIKKSEFFEQFKKNIYSVYGAELEKFKAEGLLSDDGDIIRLTQAGIDVSNYIFSDFL